MFGTWDLSVSFCLFCSFPSGAVFLVALSSAPGLAGSQVILQAVVLVCWFCLGLAAAKDAAEGCSGSFKAMLCLCLPCLVTGLRSWERVRHCDMSECISSPKSSFSLVVSHQRAIACVAAGQIAEALFLQWSEQWQGQKHKGHSVDMLGW